MLGKHGERDTQTSIKKSGAAVITHTQAHTHTRAQVQANQSSRFVNGADVIHALSKRVLLKTHESLKWIQLMSLCRLPFWKVCFMPSVAYYDLTDDPRIFIG